MFSDPWAEFAVDAIRRAADIIQRVQREMVTPALTKQDRSPVTVADLAAQAVVGRMIAEQAVEAPLVAEESSEPLRRAENQESLQQVARFVRHLVPSATPASVCQWIDVGTAEPGGHFWTLDPLDGTKGFLRGQQYAVAMARIEQGQVVLGALACPNLVRPERPRSGDPGTCVVAVRGQGAWTSSLADDGQPWTPLRVSDCRTATGARLLRSVESGHTNTGQIGQLIERLAIGADPVAMDSQAKYAVLAAGGGDCLVRLLSPSRPDYREKIWDQAAGSLAVEEAGGRVSDLAGRPLDFGAGRTLAHNTGILATNGHLHAVFLDALAKLHAA